MAASSKLLKATSSSGRSRSPAAFDAVDLAATSVLQCALALFEGRQPHQLDGTPLVCACKDRMLTCDNRLRPKVVTCETGYCPCFTRQASGLQYYCPCWPDGHCRPNKLQWTQHSPKGAININTRLTRPGEDWKPLLCSAMADGLLPGAGKKLARQALRALCGGHSAYRDAKGSFRLRLQLQVRNVQSARCSWHQSVKACLHRLSNTSAAGLMSDFTALSMHMAIESHEPCVIIAAIRAAARRDRGFVKWWTMHMQAVLCCGAKHVQRGVSEHEPAAELLGALRQLQRTAADRPPCWALLCADAAGALPRLVHGALAWCTPARLPALQLVATALGAKGHSKGCVLRAHGRTRTRTTRYLIHACVCQEFGRHPVHRHPTRVPSQPA